MAVTIHIPTPLRPFTGDQAVVEADGSTVAEVLRHLIGAHTGLRSHLFTPDGRLRSFVNVYLNDEDIRHLNRERTAVSPSDSLSIVPSVAGGVEAEAAPAETLPELTRDELSRYSRHLTLPEVGVQGQRRLKAARVLCVGAGGLGSPASLYLAAAGVGTIGLVDFDVVDASNLQRQILYGTSDVGKSKLSSARARLNGLNPGVRIVTHEVPLTSANALDIVRDYDVVIDGADNFPTRYLVNDACVLLGKPNAYGSIFRFDGQASVFATANGPCYRCLYPEPPPPGLVPSCAEGGVLGVLPGVIGTIQATEAIKLILGAGQTLAGRLLLFDALNMTFRSLKVRRDPACPICGDHRTITALIDYDQFCGLTPAAQPGGSTSTGLPPEAEITVEELRDRLDRGAPVWILDVREKHEYEICRLEGSTLIPLGDLPNHIDALPRGDDVEIIVHCKMGGRSAKAVSLLRERGFAQAKNLKGGILEWIQKIDPTQTKY